MRRLFPLVSGGSVLIQSARVEFDAVLQFSALMRHAFVGFSHSFLGFSHSFLGLTIHF
jgi:hypothetical protein